jgi:8-oxo-dGTP diphosphatase
MINVIVALVKNNGDQYLFLKRKKGEHDGTSWSFPSGKIEQGETEEDAVIREVLEETGVTCTPHRKIGERILTSLDIKIHYWIAYPLFGDVIHEKKGEVTAVAYRTAPEIKLLVNTEDMHESVIKELNATLSRKPIYPPPNI